MKSHFPGRCFQIVVLSLFFSIVGGFSIASATLKVAEKSILEVPQAPPPITWELDQGIPEISGWDEWLLAEPRPKGQLQKKRFGLTQGSGFFLKAPGRLPGIELGVEMHSLGALQSVVPPERLPKALNFHQDQPLLLSPSNNSPDYNGGFLRFRW